MKNHLEKSEAIGCDLYRDTMRTWREMERWSASGSLYLLWHLNDETRRHVGAWRQEMTLFELSCRKARFRRVRRFILSAASGGFMITKGQFTWLLRSIRCSKALVSLMSRKDHLRKQRKAKRRGASGFNRLLHAQLQKTDLNSETMVWRRNHKFIEAVM